MESAFIHSIVTIFRSAGEHLPAFIAALGTLLINPAFIATFLFFTLVIWVGMSGEDREPLSSFSRAGIIAFIATVFMFVVIAG